MRRKENEASNRSEWVSGVCVTSVGIDFVARSCRKSIVVVASLRRCSPWSAQCFLCCIAVSFLSKIGRLLASLPVNFHRDLFAIICVSGRPVISLSSLYFDRFFYVNYSTSTEANKESRRRTRAVRISPQTISA